MTFIFTGWALDQTEDVLNKILTPIVKRLNSTEGVTISASTQPGLNVSDLVGTGSSSPGLFAGVNAIMGSRLWDRNALEDPRKLEATFRCIEPNVVQSNFVSGLGVRDISKVDTASVTPAWRRSYVHISKIPAQKSPLIVTSKANMRRSHSC